MNRRIRCDAKVRSANIKPAAKLDRFPRCQHSRTPENSLIQNGYAVCKRCKYEQQAEYRRRVAAGESVETESDPAILLYRREKARSRADRLAPILADAQREYDASLDASRRVRGKGGRPRKVTLYAERQS